MEFPETGTRIVEPEDDGERWRFALRSPMPALRPFIEGYCHYELDASAERGAHQHLPHRGATLIFALDGAIESFDRAGRSCRVGAGEGFLAGLHTETGKTRGATHQRGIEVKLSPLAAHLLLGGLPMEALANRAIGLDALLGREATELGARLLDAATPDPAFALLEAFLARRILCPRREPDPGVVFAWRALVQSAGQARIGDLVEALGWSRRRLGSAFHRAIGLGPKTTARVLRFDAAMERWKAAPHTPWVEVALASGYSDQAHFSREVRALCDQSPTELAARLRPATGALLAPDEP